MRENSDEEEKENIDVMYFILQIFEHINTARQFSLQEHEHDIARQVNLEEDDHTSAREVSLQDEQDDTDVNDDSVPEEHFSK